MHTLNQVSWIDIQWKKFQNAFKKEIQITHLILELYVHCTMTKLQSSNSAWLPLLNIEIVLGKKFGLSISLRFDNSISTSIVLLTQNYRIIR